MKESGELDTTLERVVYLLDKQSKLRAKIIGMMAYPCFVVLMATGVTLIMLTFVFPAFKGVYDSMGKKLPWLTQTFMDTGCFLKTT